MPNRDLEHEVTSTLRQQVDLHPFVPRDLPTIRRQGKRRLVRNGLGVALVAAMILLGALGVARSVTNPLRPEPMNSPSPVVPSASKLAYTLQLQGIFVHDQDGRSTLASRGGQLGGWFPDGDSLLVYKGSETATRLYRVSADGRGVLRFQTPFQPRVIQLQGWRLTTHPRLSPDGQQLAIGGFAPSSVAAGRGLYVTDLTGGGAHQVFGGQAYEPAWSPDGTALAFSGPAGQIWVVGTDGQGLHALPLPAGSRFAGEPAWSPDGTTLAFSVEGAGLWIVHRDGTGLTQLVGSDNQPNTPSWAPDGHSLAFSRSHTIKSSGDGGPTNIFSIDIATSVITPLVAERGYDLAPSWWLPPPG